MSNKTDIGNDVLLEMVDVGNYEEFSCSTMAFSVMMKMKIVRKQLLKKLHLIARRQYKIRQPMRMATGQRVYFMQEGNEGSPILALETFTDMVQLQSIKRTRQGTRD
jgi:hypothetical protein